MKTFLAMATLLACGLVRAALPESMRVYPTPAKAETTGPAFAVPRAISLSREGQPLDADARRVLERAFAIEEGAPFTLVWRATEGGNPEGYVLRLTRRGVEVEASTGTGCFYAMQTLRQLVASGMAQEAVVEDAPVLPVRGTVEGFYGQPWSFEARKSQFRFYGDWKMNTYIYGPKDDPYHGFSTRWRDPYPEAEARQLAELVRVAHENKVKFVWAVHPGRDISWKSDRDMKACVAKFEQMYALGVRAFAVFFDDISGEGSRAGKQVELLNYVNRTFVRAKGDVAPLLLCPTQYNRAWAGGDYLETLGRGLDPDIAVLWTGNTVCCDITEESVDWIARRLGRAPTIWWNWPVADYTRGAHLLLGRAYGLDPAAGPRCAGFVSNPMDKPEASKIGLFGVADYTWNPAAYDSGRAWRDGIARLFPRHAEAVRRFAGHNADQGANVHGYRRDESREIKPAVDALLDALRAGAPLPDSALRALRSEFAAIEAGAAELLAATPGGPRPGEADLALFLEDAADWLAAFRAFGRSGAALCDALAGDLPPEKALCIFLAARAERRDISRRHGAKPFQKSPVEVATRILTPFQDVVADLLHARLWALCGKTPPKAASRAYRFITNVPALADLRVQRDDIYVRLPKIHEPKTLAPGEWIGIQLPDGVPAVWVHFWLGSAEATRQGRVQVSRDGGASWGERATVIQGSGKPGEMEIRRISPDDRINAVRYINVSNAPVALTLELFKVDVPPDAHANHPDSMTDGSLATCYTLPARQTVRVPLAGPGAKPVVLADGPLAAVREEADELVLVAGETGVDVYEIVR